MWTLNLVIVTLALVDLVISEKVFKSVPVTVKSYENDTVLLPCYVDQSDSKLRVRWYKNDHLLGDSADPNQLLPPRIRMHANFSLQLDSLQASDTADYTCEVIRPEPMGPIRQTHSIEVQFSPTIRTVPEDGFLEVKKGDYVDIGCEVSGTPEPIVDWRKNGEPMALLEHRTRMRFKAEHRLLAGVYECTANNGVGDPVRAAIRVVVHDAPEVTAERTFVHTAIGLRAALAARVEFSVPPARTAWYRDGRPVNTHDDRIVQMVQGEMHQLIFRSVRLADFGNYTFRAQNKLGMADVSFKLTGVPNAASFKVDSALNKATSTSFTLIWEVDSYSTIIEYNLWLRPYVGRNPDAEGFTTEPPNLWRKVVVPGDSSDGPIHSAKYTVTGLTPTTVYEAIVTSRNRFGWSKQSAILHFATEPGTGRRPSTSDYSDITPVLQELELENELEAHNITLAQVLGQEKTSSGAWVTPSSSAILIFVIGAIASGRRDEKGERSLQDIINLLKETDDVPAFVAKRLHKLPPVTFDHVDVTRLLKDITTLKATLAEVQLKLEVSESAISDLRAELLSLKRSDSVSRSFVASNVNTRRVVERKMLPSAVLSRRQHRNLPAPLAADERDSPRPAAAARPAAVELTSSGTTSTPSRSYAAAAAAAAPAAPSRRSQPLGIKPCEVLLKKVTVRSPKGQCDKEGFIKVEKKRKTPASRNHHGNAPVGPEHSLRPEVRSTQLYVSRLHWSTKVEELVDFVRRKSNFTLRVERLASRHKVNFSSFVVRVPTHHLETFMKEDFWPQGVVFRKFRGRLPADTRYTSLTQRVT